MPINRELELLNHEKAFLQSVDALELQQRIADFRSKDFKRLSYGDIQKAILDVICFDTLDGQSKALLRPAMAQYRIGTKFYRVRTISENDHMLPLKAMSKPSDCWAPPASKVPIGRLNRQNEPLLYASPNDWRIAIDELKIPDGAFFSLVVYEARTDINVAVIGRDNTTEGLNREEILKRRMIQDFIHQEFVRAVGEGTEYLYKISESIAKDYYDFPPELQDAWCYPSIAAIPGWNVAFRPQKCDKLQLVGVQISKVERIQDWDYNLRVFKIAGEIEGSNDLAYYDIGSPEQLEMFPDMLV